MARYKVLEVSFINNRIHQPGEFAELAFKDDGAAGPNLQAVDAEGNPLEAGAAIPKLDVKITRPRGKKPDTAQQSGDASTAPTAGAQGEGGSVGHTDLV